MPTARLVVLACLPIAVAAAGAAEAAPKRKAGPRAPKLYVEFLETPDFNRAAGAARRLDRDGIEAQLRRKGDGFLVVAGPRPIKDRDAETKRFVEEGSPAPSGYGVGDDYGVATRWRAPAPTPLARRTLRAGQRARLTHEATTVEIVWRDTPDGAPAPAMTGRTGERVLFETGLMPEAANAASGELRFMRLGGATAAPSVVLTLYTGGLHCCTLTAIASMDAQGRWSVAHGRKLDGSGYDFEDIDGDDVVELVAPDNSFLYAFSAYSASFAPTRVARVEGARVVDVTGEPRFRPFLIQHVHALEFGRTPEQWGINGFLGGWVAAKALIGEGPQAWTRMLALQEKEPMFAREECPDGADDCPDDKKRVVPFPETLEKHLRENGYVFAIPKAEPARAEPGKSDAPNAAAQAPAPPSPAPPSPATHGDAPKAAPQ